MSWIEIEQKGSTKTKVSVLHLRKLARKKRELSKNKNTFSYDAFLVGQRWQSFKRKYWENHEKKCIKCGSLSNVCIHHKTYKNFKREKEEDVVALCEGCHKKFHNRFGTQKDMRKNTDYFLRE